MRWLVLFRFLEDGFSDYPNTSKCDKMSIKDLILVLFRFLEDDFADYLITSKCDKMSFKALIFEFDDVITCEVMIERLKKVSLSLLEGSLNFACKLPM